MILYPDFKNVYTNFFRKASSIIYKTKFLAESKVKGCKLTENSKYLILNFFSLFLNFFLYIVAIIYSATYTVFGKKLFVSFKMAQTRYL